MSLKTRILDEHGNFIASVEKAGPAINLVQEAHDAEMAKKDEKIANLLCEIEVLKDQIKDLKKPVFTEVKKKIVKQKVVRK